MLEVLLLPAALEGVLWPWVKPAAGLALIAALLSPPLPLGAEARRRRRETLLAPALLWKSVQLLRAGLGMDRPLEHVSPRGAVERFWPILG